MRIKLDGPRIPVLHDFPRDEPDAGHRLHQRQRIFRLRVHRRIEIIDDRPATIIVANLVGRIAQRILTRKRFGLTSGRRARKPGPRMASKNGRYDKHCKHGNCSDSLHRHHDHSPSLVPKCIARYPPCGAATGYSGCASESTQLPGNWTDDFALCYSTDPCMAGLLLMAACLTFRQATGQAVECKWNFGSMADCPIARSTFRLHRSLRVSRLVEGGFFVPRAGPPGAATAPRALARNRAFLCHR